MRKYAMIFLTAFAMASAHAVAADRSGDQVFQAVCTACHSSGVMGAPKFGDKADWAPRIAKGKSTLYSHALGGFNSMPPKGGCATCSDKEVKNAVDYMVSKAK